MSKRKPEDMNLAPGEAAAPGDDYEVGYRKPPVRSQFPKGRSGNPTGRSRGKGSAGRSLKKILFETVPVRRGDRAIRASRYEVVLRRFVNDALKGDWRLGLKILALVPYAELLEQSQRSRKMKPITEEEAEEGYRQMIEAGRVA
jgi:Family of unknown function (DUF5681)